MERQCKEAIIEKVKRIFDGLEADKSVYITINAEEACVPTIRYVVTEYIVPKEEKNE